MTQTHGGKEDNCFPLKNVIQNCINKLVSIKYKCN